MLSWPVDSDFSKRQFVAGLVLCLIAPGALFAGAAPAADSVAVLTRNCLTCHNTKSKQGGLDLSTREGLLHGGASGAAVIPGDAARSLLYRLISHQQEPAMPFQSAALPKETIAQIAEWINAGATYGDTAPDRGLALFAEVQPVLVAQCLACHGGGKTNRSGFDLASRDTLLRGGDTGVAVVPGKAAESALWKRVRHETDPGMPYQGTKLSESAIAKIGEW